MVKQTSPIRWDRIQSAISFLKALELDDATDQQKLFFLFRHRTNIKQGFSLYEMAIILNQDKIQRDPETHEWHPTLKSIYICKEVLRQFRREMEFNSIVLYCIRDEETGYSVYFNITTMELYQIIMKRVDKIIKGIQRNRKKALELLKMPRKQRNKLLKDRANFIRRLHLEKLKKDLSKERQKELEVIQKKFEVEEQERLKAEEKRLKENDKKIEKERTNTEKQEDEATKSKKSKQEKEKENGDEENNE